MTPKMQCWNSTITSEKNRFENLKVSVYQHDWNRIESLKLRMMRGTSAESLLEKDNISATPPCSRLRKCKWQKWVVPFYAKGCVCMYKVCVCVCVFRLSNKCASVLIRWSGLLGGLDEMWLTDNCHVERGRINAKNKGEKMKWSEIK